MSNLDQYTVEELDRENRELKARVNHLESAMKQDIHKTGYNFRLQSALDGSPSQSLADIKADAVLEFSNDVFFIPAHIDYKEFNMGIVDAAKQFEAMTVKYSDQLKGKS